MKLSIRGIFFSFLALTTLCCNPISRIARGTEIVNDHSDTIQRLLIFPTYAHIDMIENRDMGNNNEKLSQLATNEIYSQLSEFLPATLNKHFMQGDALVKESIAGEGHRLIKSLRKSFNPKTAKVPDYLLQVLDAQNQDYGLLILQVGFTRTHDNMVKETLRRENQDWRSLGIYQVRPYSSYSAMYGFLIDRKKQRVIRYKELRWPNKEPNDKYIIRTQVRDIILTSFRLGN
ncbi:MAG: hypothetical protein EOO00_06540 [Chitinophagaceae bacterium]|nr:MAG: hypothetical protein EOO00_06540 [Chitinophagaceae bacterium]